MRVRQIVATVVLLGTVGALSGCAGRSDGLPRGLVAPTTTSPTTSSTTSTTSPAAPTAVTKSPAAKHPVTTSPVVTNPIATKPAKLVLADTGIGGLHLGQSKKQALATGLLGKIVAKATDVGCDVYRGKRGIDLVYFAGGKLMIISVTKSIKTDKGIGIGDTYLTLHQKYPDAIMEPESETARIYPAAPKAQIKARYRIAMSGAQGYPDDTILELALQANAQPCYE